jgi:hypothetical protein
MKRSGSCALKNIESRFWQKGYLTLKYLVLYTAYMSYMQSMSIPHLTSEEKRKLRLVLAHILNNPGFRLATSKDQTKAIYALSSMCRCSSPELQLVAIKELVNFTDFMTDDQYSDYLRLNSEILKKELSDKLNSPALAIEILRNLRFSFVRYNKTGIPISKFQAGIVYDLLCFTLKSATSNIENTPVRSMIETLNKLNLFYVDLTEKIMDKYLDIISGSANGHSYERYDNNIAEQIAKALAMTVKCHGKTLEKYDISNEYKDRLTKKMKDLIHVLSEHEVEGVRKELVQSLGKMHYDEQSGMDETIDLTIQTLSVDPSESVRALAKDAVVERFASLNKTLSRNVAGFDLS